MCCILQKCYTKRLKCVAWLPVVGEILVMLWTYYVYVICLCYFSSNVVVEAAVLLFVYHSLLAVTLWCHCKSITTRPMMPPQQFHYDDAQWNKLNNEFLWIQRREEMENLRLKLGIKTIQASLGRGLLVYCQQCNVIKPDRCHHCSRCGVCVLKMDHHCPWINNCVGYHNYKYFLLFVVYCLAYCVFVPLTSLRFVIAFFVDVYNDVDVSGDYNRIQIIVMFVFLVITGVALLPLIKLHWNLLSTNTTTLENTRPLGLIGQAPDIRLFDRGRSENLCHIFGHRKLLWFFPVFTSLGDGCHFPLRDEIIFDKEADCNQNKEWGLGDWRVSFSKNSGDKHMGDQNSGDQNSGDKNRGDQNSGDKNRGDQNSGDKNRGDQNSGAENRGDHNSGDKNRGDQNSGGENRGETVSDRGRDISVSEYMGETVWEMDREDKKINAVQERNGENQNRTNNCDYFCQTGH